MPKTGRGQAPLSCLENRDRSPSTENPFRPIPVNDHRKSIFHTLTWVPRSWRLRHGRESDSQVQVEANSSSHGFAEVAESIPHTLNDPT